MSYTLQKSPAQRYSGLAVVIGLHLAVAYLFASGLGKTVVQVVTGPIETRVIEEVQELPEEPPPPPPMLESPPPEFVPPPEIVIAAETPPPATAITAVQSKVATPEPAPPAPAVATTPPRSDARRPNAQPRYPAVSRRLGEEGVVTLQLYVLADGRVGEARVQKSSGFPRLDEAAVREAKRSWRFLPAKRGSEAIAAWMSINVRFELQR